MNRAGPARVIHIRAFFFQVPALCVGERPSTIDVKIVNDGIVVDNVTDIMLPQDPFTNVLTVNTTLTVLEDQRYTAVVSFSNLAGEFSNSSTVDFSKE